MLSSPCPLRGPLWGRAVPIRRAILHEGCTGTSVHPRCSVWQDKAGNGTTASVMFSASTTSWSFPPFTIHQHGGDEATGCQLYVPQSRMFSLLGLTKREQIKFGEKPEFPQGTEPIHDNDGKRAGKRNPGKGRLKWFTHPEGIGSARRLWLYMQEIPPGSRSGRHRHFAEEQIFVIKGRGYDFHDQQRWNWERGDLINIPSMVGHQHFNSDMETQSSC